MKLAAWVLLVVVVLLLAVVLLLVVVQVLVLVLVLVPWTDVLPAVLAVSAAIATVLALRRTFQEAKAARWEAPAVRDQPQQASAISSTARWDLLVILFFIWYVLLRLLGVLAILAPFALIIIHIIYSLWMSWRFREFSLPIHKSINTDKRISEILNSHYSGELYDGYSADCIMHQIRLISAIEEKNSEVEAEMYAAAVAETKRQLREIAAWQKLPAWKRLLRGPNLKKPAP